MHRERDRNHQIAEGRDRNGTEPTWRDSSGAQLGNSRQPAKTNAVRDGPVTGRRSDYNASSHRSSSQWGFHISAKPGPQSSRPTSGYLPGETAAGVSASKDRVNRHSVVIDLR